MTWLIRLYPRWWRERYGDEFAALLDDLPARSRPRLAVNIALGAVDARLHRRTVPMNLRSDRAAIRRGLVAGLLMSIVLAAEVVRSNVLYPSREDNDGPTVLAAYASTFVVLLFVGWYAQRRAATPAGPVIAGAAAGVIIAVLTIGTFFVVDNVFLDIVSRQPAKIDGLARSSFPSMRAYVNASLALGLVLLTTVLGGAGAALGTLGGHLGRRAGRRSGLSTAGE
ncbi:MAG TPA: hypothetical protein VFE14_18070 [Micromonosporaceae bacterium]|jgi:hypothetical protein|nr:hypothetical protein [Micromonosporaceae bacterium]